MSGLVGVSHYLGGHTALTSTQFGRHIFVDTRDCHLTPHLLTRGVWEPHVTELFIDRIARAQKRGRPLVIDVGANVGWFTLLAHGFGGAVDVVSVEPNPHHVSLLRRTLRVNGFKSPIRQVALIERRLESPNASVRLEWDPQEGGGARVVESSTGRYHDFFAQTKTLDELMVDELVSLQHEGHGPPLVLKLDVEGHEPEVVAGGLGVLGHRDPSPVLFLEHNNAFRDKTRAMYEELHNLGFALRHIRPSGQLSAPLGAPELRALPGAEMLLCERP